MVKIIFIFSLLLYAATAAAITPDELRAMSADKDRQDTQRSNRADTGAVDSLLPKSTKQPVSSKYSSSPTTKEAGASTGSIKRRHTKAVSNADKQDTSSTSVTDSNIYVPPVRSGDAANAKIVSDAIPASLVFGIRLGTWMPAKLNRDTSSAEPGTVELSISEDVIGDRRTLPAGTVLFANKTLNSGTKRMEMTVTNGITPSGQEFKLRGIIFDPLKVSGLSGIYEVNDKAVAKHGVQKGTVAAIGAAAQTFGGGNPLAAAGGAATQSVITDTGGAVEYNAPTAVIYVSPQPLIIRVEERF